jgi:hypothetical protein
VVEVLFGILGLGWLLLVPIAPWLALGPLSTAVALAPVWRIWYVPLAVVAIANLTLDAYGLFQPIRTARRLTLKLVALSCQLVVAVIILSARVWVVAGTGVRIDADLASQLPQLLVWVNTGVAIGFGTVIVITLIELGKQYYRLRASRSAQ